MPTYTGKKNFPARSSAIYTESGKPFPAALTHILWKQLEWAAGEAAKPQRCFEALQKPLQTSCVLGTQGERTIPILPEQTPAGGTPPEAEGTPITTGKHT